MIKYFFSTFFILTLLLAFSSQVHAAKVATPSATPTITTTPTPDDAEVKSNLEDRIKNIVKENLSTTEAKLQAKIVQQKLVGHVGKITQISSNGLTFNSDGDIFQASVTETTIITKTGQTSKLSALAIGDKIIVIGLITKTNVIEAKKIIAFKETPPTPRATVYAGKISSVDTKTRTIVLQTLTGNVEMLLSRKAKLTPDEFVVGQKAVVVTKLQNKDIVIFNARILK